MSIECPCCGYCEPTAAIIDLLDTIGMVAGRRVHVNSLCRCEKHNSEIGGSNTSQHLKCNAADIWVDGYTPEALHEICDVANPDGGLIIYDWGVHVDCRGYRYRSDRRLVK